MGDAAFTFEVINWQRHTLGSVLGKALGSCLWDNARTIVGILNEYWNIRGLLEEAQNWVDRICLAVETAAGTINEELGNRPGMALSFRSWAFWLKLVGGSRRL